VRPFLALRIGVLIAVAWAYALGQTTQSVDAQAGLKGMPPRATPGDYQAQVQAGGVTLAAEFKGHWVPTLESTLSTDEYVVVEVGLFGPPDTRVGLSPDGFSLRINGRKDPLPAQRPGFVVKSIRDPEWDPPEAKEAKSKSSMSVGGGDAQGSSKTPAAPVKVPIELQRAMAQRVQRAALPEGDRILPQAGVLFFPYRGKADGIRSVELIYDGQAGEATLPLPL
jgi:hypothetical protein